MLKFEREGVLEAGAQAIRKLNRSVTAVPFEVSGRDACEVHCVLGEFLDGGQPVCQVAFYAKVLKGGLVFALAGPDADAAWRHGREILSRLGFLLDDVNLKLKPALLDVVLRDIPGIATPADAAALREEKEQMLEEQRRLRETAPDSAEGKRATLKLNAEKRSQAQLNELRGTLERLLQPVADAAGDIEALEGRVAGLSAELAAAGERLDAARRERDMSETIRLAAEKRIRELEELLVDVETGKAEVVKMKRKSARNQERLDELERACEQSGEALVEARGALEEAQRERDEARGTLQEAQRERDEARGALQEAQRELDEARRGLDEARGALEEARRERDEARRGLEEARQAQEAERGAAGDAEQRLAALDGELRERDEALEKSRAELAAAEAARQKAADELASAARSNDELKSELAESLTREAEDRELLAAAREALQKARDRVAELAQSGQDDGRGRQLEEQLAGLRDDWERERALTREQTRRAEAGEARVRELEAALAAAEKPAPAADAGAPREELAGRLEEALRLRVGLEASLREARGRIEALEQELGRQGEAAAGAHGAAAGDARRIAELEKRLEEVSAELARRQAEKGAGQPQPEAAEPATAGAAGARPLPHELRPAPKKGEAFHPDWDLQGLPCRSAAGVVKAWESVFNVQISLEGYPPQYCTAFLVVLNGEGRKRLFLLFRLKKNKHTLVCVPARAPQDDAALKGAVDEGLAYLRRSGFDMQPLGADHLAGALQTYFAAD